MDINYVINSILEIKIDLYQDKMIKINEISYYTTLIR